MLELVYLVCLNRKHLKQEQGHGQKDNIPQRRRLHHHGTTLWRHRRRFLFVRTSVRTRTIEGSPRNCTYGWVLSYFTNNKGLVTRTYNSEIGGVAATVRYVRNLPVLYGFQRFRLKSHVPDHLIICRITSHPSFFLFFINCMLSLYALASLNVL